MLTYSIIMTWIVGFIMGVVTLASVFVYIDGRDEKRLKQERALRLARRGTERTQEQIDADEESAIRLVEDKLGATILTYDK